MARYRHHGQYYSVIKDELMAAREQILENGCFMFLRRVSDLVVPQRRRSWMGGSIIAWMVTSVRLGDIDLVSVRGNVVVL